MTDEESDRLMADVKKARATIIKEFGPWKRGQMGVEGMLACPICNTPAALRFRRSGVNGHIQAACTTAGCVSWME